MKLNNSYKITITPVHQTKSNLTKTEFYKSTSLIKASRMILLNNFINFRIRKQINTKIYKSIHPKKNYLKDSDLNKAVYRKDYNARIKSNQLDLYSSSSNSERESSNRVSEIISEAFLEAFIEHACEPVVIQCAKDMISAALRLFSSSVLDFCIKAVLEEMVYVVVQESYMEIMDNNYIDCLNTLIDFEISNAVPAIAEKISKSIIFSLIASNLSQILPINTVVNEAINEERQSNKLLHKNILNGLIDTILNQDWIEMMVEDEICCAKLKANFNILPIAVQKRIVLDKGQDFINQVIENIYFDIINEYIANQWLVNIVNYCVSGYLSYSDIDILTIDSNKKRISMSLKVTKYKTNN
jgi:hypothetical protein